MDRASGATIVALVCASWAMAASAPARAADAPIPPKPADRTVYLYGAADLDRLRATNFNHYQRAEKIIADGSKLCRPGAPTLQLAARYGASYMSCAANLLTSNPPKKLLDFRLDSTRYIALITLTNDDARLVKAVKTR
jgi:hypothetical protein